MTRISQNLARIVSVLLVSAAVLIALPVAAKDDAVTRFAKTLSELRIEVEALSSDVELAKQDLRARLRSYNSQKTDLGLQIQRETRRTQGLKARRQKEMNDVATASSASDDVKPAVTRSIAKLRTQIDAGLPFKRVERRAALDRIEEQVNQGLVSPEKATARLWALVEDELRLTKESGLYRQTITLDGQEELVEIARIGMVAMYFRTSDGRLGKTRQVDGEWQYRRVSSEEGETQIHALFDAFQKQIRVGYFALPNGLEKETR